VVWRWTPLPTRCWALTPISGLLRRASPTRTPGVRPGSPNYDGSSDERMMQPRTGCRPSRELSNGALRWLRDAMPNTFISVHHWMSLGEYIYLQVLGVTAAGTSTAAWMGMAHRSVGSGAAGYLRSAWS